MKRLLLAFLGFSITVFAVGPKLPCLLTWTPSPSPDVTGYWFYWRATNSSYADTQRWPIATNAQGYDLRVLGLAKGDYAVMMTATNATAESDPSPDFLWHYSNPNKPTGVQVQ